MTKDWAEQRWYVKALSQSLFPKGKFVSTCLGELIWEGLLRSAYLGVLEFLLESVKLGELVITWTC